ncbi:helix-turn-helix transcriptional regulator [Pseudomonas sp. REP124]|uniref:helix-turn-helix domain-containing protein n=1 Tax=Pseudomonas sp. REP124 TaxID=2875731 RepID=UPI001CCF1A89|nr:helix-turn-helix transcriptional regulator [Pseudomonas sp. REP124]MBZ9783629.1 helix-turn-helix transcriptional regulator [Pseudomonas sp. REP124]
MRLRAQSDQVLAATVGVRLQTLRLKKNISLDAVAENAAISRQTLHVLLNQGKGTLINLIAVLRALGELERLSSLLEEIRPSPLQVIQMEGKKRQRATGRRREPRESPRTDARLPQSSDW